MLATSTAAARPAVLPLFAAAPAPDRVSGLFQAATELARLLGQGRAARQPRACARRWRRRSAPRTRRRLGLEGCLRSRRGGAGAVPAQIRPRHANPRRLRVAMLDMLNRLAERLPSQTRRSEESNRFQQFSTPIALGLAAAEAASITADDLVLEPSAGTGLLAIFAELAGAGLALNEIADTRAGLLGRLYRDCASHAQRRAHQRSARSGGAAQRRADEPALLIVAACREALSPRLPSGISPRLSRGCARAARLVAITGHKSLHNNT